MCYAGSELLILSTGSMVVKTKQPVLTSELPYVF